MSDNRELLELAAKAAGVTGRYFWNINDAGIETQGGGVWNPLDDDGQALRLAVKLRITVELTARTVLAAADGASPSADVLDLLGVDPSAATRRAIVRAAAEIAKATA